MNRRRSLFRPPASDTTSMQSRSMHHASTPFWPKTILRVAALVLAFGVLPQAIAGPELLVERWYEMFRQGQKTGSLHVRWTKSSWNDKETVRDTTVMKRAQYRRMVGLRDRFETRVQLELERDADGTLWWQRTRSVEAGRVLIEELRWTGKGYEYTSSLEGRDQRQMLPSVAPAMADAEAFVAPKVRAKQLKVGATFPLPLIDVRGRRVRVHELTVEAHEKIASPSMPSVLCWKIVQRDPTSDVVTTLWLDDQGSFVRLRDGAGSLIQRASPEQATKTPSRYAEFNITVPSTPSLPRVFSADRLWVDVRLEPDQHRKLPDLPDSPWSEVLAVTGNDTRGWTLSMELRADHPDRGTPRVETDASVLERYLESTALMPVNAPALKLEVEQVMRGVQDPMLGARKLVRHVYETLDKRSPNVAQASAVQILDDRCGDCSEHALLFVALCRAAGIPARRCSGYVCIGSVWGSHSWAEIYLGGWLSADPTTGELGGGARYLFFGYPDEPKSFPTVTAQRVEGRVQCVVTGLQEGASRYDLTDRSRSALRSKDGRNVHNVLCGLEARDLPEGWTANASHAHRLTIRGPGIRADLYARADQGADMESGSTLSRYGKRTTFAGAPALVYTMSRARTTYQIYSRRRIVQLMVREGDEKALATLERVLAQAFAEFPAPWADAAASGADLVDARVRALHADKKRRREAARQQGPKAEVPVVETQDDAESKQTEPKGELTAPKK